MKDTNIVDKRILHLLSENSEISQIELADRLKISQPAVSARIRKLKEKGALAYLVGTDIKKAQLFLAKIDISTNDAEHLLETMNKCPMYLNSFLTSGRYNLTIFLIGENMRSIMSCTDSHLRHNPLIMDMEFNLVVTPSRDFIVPINPILEKKEITPCEKRCKNCNLYSNDRCLGCPASIDYKGDLL
ncbi:MAG: Lrp/AsnC family transcriptional regulator, leucine-responsive regulatory protein [Thermoproteota archaeon]|nr:Lrp/AsnC family transcriptional regulator, leucine-responsive regulatory protein [Thermoproteota archaeon]